MILGSILGSPGSSTGRTHIASTSVPNCRTTHFWGDGGGVSPPRGWGGGGGGESFIRGGGSCSWKSGACAAVSDAQASTKSCTRVNSVMYKYRTIIEQMLCLTLYYASEMRTTCASESPLPHPLCLPPHVQVLATNYLPGHLLCVLYGASVSVCV